MSSAATLNRPTRLCPLVPIEEWLTVEGKLRTLGPLKDIVAGSPESCIGLHGGLPAADCFPFAGISITTHDGTTTALDPSQLSAVQLQYNMSPHGYPPLREWAARHVQQVHVPPCPCDVMITDGNSHSLEMLTSLLMQPGDSILVEEFTYPHMLECVLLAKGAVPLPVPLDAHGIVPAQLRQVLEQQRSRAGGSPLPRLLYTVPVGQNPTGAVTPLERRKEIYLICREFGILIIEDDPFLQYPQGPAKVPGIPHATEAGSYLSLDTDGRVVRLDSFSKFFSPGLRLGWAAAQPALIERLMTMLTAQSLGASGVTQLMTWQVLSTWGDEGLECHVCAMQREYARRADIIHSAAHRELAGLAQWERPVAGMFMWAKLLGVEDAYDILPQLREAQVVVVPGRIAHPRVHDPQFKCPWIRLAFSYVTDQDLVEGIARLGRVLRRLQQPPGQTPACTDGI